MKLKLRVKVFIDDSGKPWMVANGYLNTGTQRIIACGMRDDEADKFDMSLDDWNDLPFAYFETDCTTAPHPGHKFNPNLN